jgi:hypothetical protein
VGYGTSEVTVIELRAIAALRSVKFPEKNWHARCAVRLDADATVNPGRPLRIAEASDLWFIVYRYRRQITDREVIARADEIVNGAKHLAF